jgi:hypothetical protein
MFLQRLFIYIIHQPKITSSFLLQFRILYIQDTMFPKAREKNKEELATNFHIGSESFAVMKRFPGKFAFGPFLAPNLGTETCWPKNPVWPC